MSIDLETTGLEPSSSDIIEVGAARFINGVKTEMFSSLIRPTRSVPDRISALTGLTPGELDWARSFSEVMPDFLAFIADYPIVAHNADFDMGFLELKLPRINVSFPQNEIWDNLKLGVLLYPEMQSFGLEALADAFGISFTKTHRATDDCVVTGSLFLTFLQNAPAIWGKELWARLTEHYLINTSIGRILKRTFEHPDFDKYAQAKPIPYKTSAISDSPRKIKFGELDEKSDLLIRVSAYESDNMDILLSESELYGNKRRHYFTFPTSQFPGDFWGIDKRWNEVLDRSPDLVLYPGRERLLCKRQMQIFIEDDRTNPLSLTNFETAVLSSFADTSNYGNFSRLSWWIWNNLQNISHSIPFINANNCDTSNCPFEDDCFYIKTYKEASEAKILGFPYRVIKEEGELPSSKNIPKRADLTVFNPEGIFRDNLTGGTRSFILNHGLVLMGKIQNFLSEDDLLKAKPSIDKTKSSIELLLKLVDNTIMIAGNKRLQKGKRFFVFLVDNLLEESLELMNEIENLCSIINEFLDNVPDTIPESATIIASMLKLSIENLRESVEMTIKGKLVMCLDRLENAPSDNCRFLFFPHIYRKEFFKIPSSIDRLIYITHHISGGGDWDKYLRFLGRQSANYHFSDFAPNIPDGNKVYLSPPGIGDDPVSKKRILNIKGEVVSKIVDDFPGRSLVIVRGSQELLNFKYRLSPKLKENGYWPLFQKQDGPKGLLIREFSKHKNVVFFGLADLLEDIHLFENPPDNLILESLHLTSLQDPIEAFIKIEMESAGWDHMSDYLEPKIHFTLMKSLRRWKNYLEGHARIFILDERLANADHEIAFIENLNGIRLNI